MGKTEKAPRSENAPLSLRYGISVLLTMIFVSVTLNLVILPFAQVANEISEAYGIDDLKFSLLIGLFFAVPVTLMSVGGGWLSDRFSRRKLLFAAMVVWMLGAVWTALAPTYEQMAISRMVVAAAVGIKFPLVMTWVNDAFPVKRRAQAIGALFVVLNIGPAISAVTAGLVLKGAQSGVFDVIPLFDGLAPWRAGLLFLALLSIIPLPMVAFLKDVDRAPAESPTDVTGTNEGKAAPKSSYPLWVVLSLGVSAALLSLADTANLGWLPTVLKRQYGFDSAQVGFAFGLIVMIAGTLGPMIAGFLDGRLHNRFGLVGSLITCAIASALCAPMIAAFAQPNATLLIGALIVSGILSVMALTVAYIAIQSLLSSDRRGMGTGFAHALENLARAAAPTIVATVSLSFATMPVRGLGVSIAIICVVTYVISCLLFAGAAIRLRSQA